MVPNAVQRHPQEAILRGKGGIPKVVPPLYEEGPPRLTSHGLCEITQQQKIEDSANLRFWEHFLLLLGYLRGIPKVIKLRGRLPHKELWKLFGEEKHDFGDVG